MTENIKPISFMGYNLNELGEVEGAIPVLKHFTDELHDRIIQEREGYVYRQCLQLEIDPDVLKKQLIEIRRLNTIIREKDEQIEKMKCCANCKHEQDSNTNYYCEDCKRFANETDIDKWEYKET